MPDQRQKQQEKQKLSLLQAIRNSAKLNQSYYLGDDVVKIAKSLLGKVLTTNFNKKLTSGIIVETEAYSWTERGCHAYGFKKTPRNEPMFDAGGVSYVYLCYGVHELFNVVTNAAGIADAVLIRALQPVDGLDEMMKRVGVKSSTRITSGPGKLTRALGITRMHNRIDITGDEIWIEDRDFKVKVNEIEASARIGLNSNWEDSFLPWRFTIKNNEWISR